ncbi:MAG: DUF5011 domain-containing protein [Bacteroidetes bacterium]|nr:DUF5011 domain-containing protein [Bacteroidota bacterium]
MFKLIITPIFLFLLHGCMTDATTEQLENISDTIPPKLRLMGRTHDTAYLFCNYIDPGAVMLDEHTKKERCMDMKDIEIKGEVDTRIQGAYLLSYTGKDSVGNKSAALTRTVHVVENGAGFLYGPYEVAYTCTAVIRGTFTPTITSDTYVANAKPFYRNYSFELDRMKVGPEFIKPETYLADNLINASFFSTMFDFKSSCSGTLSAAKNSFTLETVAYQYNPAINYFCKNVYTQVKLREIKK